MTRVILTRGVFVACIIGVLVSGFAYGKGLYDFWRDGKGPNRLVVPLRVDRTASVQLFYDAGDGIRAEDCATVGVVATTRLEDVAFELPRTGILALRFDPLPFPGVFDMGVPRLESASGRVLAQLERVRVEPIIGIEQWLSKPGGFSGVVPEGQIDPQIVFGFDAPLPVGAPHFPWETMAVFFGVTAGALLLRRVPAVAEWSFRSSAAKCGSLPNGGAWGWWAALAVVAGVQGALLMPLPVTFDLPLWDEANYAAAGAAWAAHGGSLGAYHASPAYTASYAVLAQWLPIDAAIFAQHLFIKLGTTLCLFVILARWTRASVAMALALVWAASWFQLEFPLLVYQGAWLWFLAALVAIDRWPLAGFGLLLIAAGARQEYLLAAALVGVWLLARNRFHFGRWLYAGESRIGRITGGIAAALAIGVGVFVAARSEFGQSDSRAWFAFQQHYAVRLFNQGNSGMVEPFLEYPEVIKRDFGDAPSLREAWKVNRAAFTEHVAANLRGAPGEVFMLWRPHLQLAAPAFSLLACAALLMILRHRPVNELEDEPVRRGNSIVAGLAGLAAITPGLLILAKGAYLLAVVPLVAACAVWCIAWIPLAREPSRSRPARVVVSALAIGCALWLLAVPAPFGPGTRGRPVMDTVRVLREVWPESGRHVLLGVAASSYAHYIGDERCEGIEALASAGGVADGDLPLDQRIARAQPHGVLVTDDWRRLRDFDAAKAAEIFSSPDWRAVPVAAGTLYLRVER